MGQQHGSVGSLVVIGGGMMAEAVVAGAFDAGVAAPVRTTVVDPAPERRAVFEAMGAQVHAGAADALAASSPDALLLVATKPQVLPAVEVALRGAGVRWDGLAASILAGATSGRVRTALGGSARVVRVMPNTPARIGMGMTAIAPGDGASDADAARVENLFRAVGEVVRIDERMMDAFTAIAGSGPAYLFYLAEAMVEGGVRTGFERDMADRIVRAVLRGAAGLLHGQTDKSPGALRAAVTSKGGTTAAACESMDASGVRDAVVRAVVAARDRGAELGRG